MHSPGTQQQNCTCQVQGAPLICPITHQKYLEINVRWVKLFFFGRTLFLPLVLHFTTRGLSIPHTFFYHIEVASIISNIITFSSLILTYPCENHVYGQLHFSPLYHLRIIEKRLATHHFYIVHQHQGYITFVIPFSTVNMHSCNGRCSRTCLCPNKATLKKKSVSCRPGETKNRRPGNKKKSRNIFFLV